jgi:NAD(P)-dependent dehydrogenase (short-subunit alcohol dehydrogenase family)
MTTAPRAALITGASQGLGRALAFELAQAGLKLALVARDKQRLYETVRSLRALDAEAVGIAADIGDKRAIHRIAGEAQALLGPIDLLIHNASTLGPTPLKLLLDTECEDFARVLETNLLGPFRLSKVEAYPRWGAYAVSKAALDHLSRVFAAELEGLGVRMLAIDPGEMDTAMHRAAIPDADPRTLARPEDVAARIARLLLDAGSIANGARITAAQLSERS